MAHCQVLMLSTDKKQCIKKKHLSMKDKIQFLAHKVILFSNAPNTCNKKIIFFLFSVLRTIDIVTVLFNPVQSLCLKMHYQL